MTANTMSSSAPANTTHDSTYDDNEDTVDQQTEAFLASCMSDTATYSDYGYTSSGDEPVQISASMLSDDDVWLLHSDTNLPPSTTAAFNAPVPVTSQPSLPIPRHCLTWWHFVLTSSHWRALIYTRRESISQDLPWGNPAKIKSSIACRITIPAYAQLSAQGYSPSNLDPRTHSVLHALLADRDKPNRDTAARNVTNRAMFQVYSESPFLIHANNFFSCCRPHLRNLPPQTAFELQSARIRMEAMEQPPYRPIHPPGCAS
jgi:hypothetical protein